jgi:hypothetical protein
MNITPARQARENSISIEVKKDGLQQRQGGDWVLRLTVQAIDMHQTIVNAPMGQRFACALVEINDDETPVDHKAMERDKWRALGAARQAGMRCKDPVFMAYLVEEFGKQIDNEDDCAQIVRSMCSVESRSDLDKVGFSQARIKWHDIDFGFQAWKAKENG